MTSYTHADLSAAIDKARGVHPFDRDLDVMAHLDLCAAILDLHKPYESVTGPRCTTCAGGTHREPWPCLTVLIVVDALTRMGAL